MTDQASVVEALGVAVAARVPVVLWGAPGTGKTSVVRAMADASGWPCETVIASIREPSDFAGLPIINRDNGAGASVAFAPPRWAERLAVADAALLFFDEISTAPPAVQAALLRVVLERTVGDLTLPDGVAVVAAANPPEQAADGWDLSPPLANRFCHLDWSIDARPLADGLSTGWAQPQLPHLDAMWEQRIAIPRSWVAGFVTVRPMLALDVPDDAATGGRAWPSPRTWDMSARLLAACDAAGASDLARSILVRGAVGHGPGIEFTTWLAEADLPDPEALLLDPDSFDLPERGDRAYAALTSVAAVVVANPTADRWLRGWRVLDRARQVAPDVAATAARSLARCRPAGAAVPDEAKAFAPMLREAGLLS
ncbi:MAG: AAA family ATPase [Actinobacteria bacterium]|nr:AAA family ATPase [Actinomycetota bacterium]